jgi:hypothetical protein
MRYDFFCNIDLKDNFFDTLKQDYPEFELWYCKKMKEKEKAFVKYLDGNIAAFLYLKEENEKLETILPKKKRLKIGTLKLSESIKGTKVGEGLIANALWKFKI